MFDLPLFLARFLPSSLFHSLTHSLAYFLLTRLYFLVLSPSLNYFSVALWLSIPLFTHLLNSLLPPSLPYSLFGPIMCLLPLFLTRSFTHSLTRARAGLFSAFILTSLRTILHACFLFSSLLYSLTPLLVCFVFDSLTHLLSLFFPHSLARQSASFLIHSLSCLRVLAHSLAPFPSSFAHSFACSLMNPLARLLSSIISHSTHYLPRPIT